jgi:FtsP/CotA-like multicopper oxidase with cupredoxin domain
MSLNLPQQSSISQPALIERRSFLIAAGASGAALGLGIGRAYTQTQTAREVTLEIAPLKLELGPDHVIDTFAYNGRVPGPALRTHDGAQININVVNHTDIDDIVHWHGLHLPAVADGAMEEGSPMVKRDGGQFYSFAAKPAGTRWYHSHNIAGTDIRRSLYSGMYGFFIIEPQADPGRYDQEILLAIHHWEPRWVSIQDIRQGPPPDNGLEVQYGSASINDKMLGMASPSVSAKASESFSAS